MKKLKLNQSMGKNYQLKKLFSTTIVEVTKTTHDNFCSVKKCC